VPRRKIKDEARQRYLISCDEKQMRVLIDALDTFTRLGMGQLRIVLDSVVDMHIVRIHEESKGRNEAAAGRLIDRELISTLASAIAAHMGYGQPVGINEANFDAKVAYEVQKVLQQAIARNQEAGSTWKSGPLRYSGLDFAECWLDEEGITAPERPQSPPAPAGTHPDPSDSGTRRRSRPSPGETTGLRRRGRPPKVPTPAPSASE
jgi:hypothetical protein